MSVFFSFFSQKRRDGEVRRPIMGFYIWDLRTQFLGEKICGDLLG